MNKWTVSGIRGLKGRAKIVALTAADFCTARIMDEAGVHLILVGDSLAMTVLGYPTTLPVTMQEMLHHCAAVARGARNALVVADMPFMSYQVSHAQALENAGRFMKEASASAVKIEGGACRASLARALTENGIPVLGHIGLTPQSVHQLGGYKVQGKSRPDAERLLTDAIELEKAGVFAVVLECVPASLAAEITRSVAIPTIGIGAGPHCDGQILVTHDMLGLYPDIKPKFVKCYADLVAEIRKAVGAYKREVEAGVFPDDSHSYSSG